MSDQSQPTPAPAPGNTAEARTETGELKDQTQTSSSAKPTSLLDDGKAAPSSAPAPGPAAPETYSFKVPDGFVIDEKVSAEASEVFKALAIPQEGAQRLMDLYIKHSLEAAEAPFKAYSDLRQEWQTAVKADPTIGDGQGLRPQVRETIGRAFDALGDPKLAQDFKEVMNLTGAGDNPAFIKAFYAFAQKITEGRPVSGRGPSPAGQAAPDAKPRSLAQALYPNLPSAS